MAGNHNTPSRLAILVAFSGSGGVERNILNLLPEFSALGVSVDVLAVLRKPVPELLALTSERIRIVDLGVRHTALALPALVRYLRFERPDALLVAKDRAIRMAILARWLSGVAVPLTGQLNTHLSASLAKRSAAARIVRTWPMRWLYPRVDQVIAVSAGVAEDAAQLTGLPLARIPVIRNPVITADLVARSQEPVDHPWVNDQTCPLIVGAGRLTQQKDFATLMRGFALLRRQRECRLLILGEGRQRGELERLGHSLGIAGDLQLTGFVTNPYPYFSRADVFALSSRWEGSGNVLTEAMALGTPVVSTDCPSGPAEMLDNGRWGRLVPVGDAEKLAEALALTLDSPPDAAALRAAVAEYAVSRSACRYLGVLGLSSGYPDA